MSLPPAFKRPQSVLVVHLHPGRGVPDAAPRAAPAGFWQSVTGSLRPGESPRSAALREVWEETGLRGRARP